MTSYSPNLGFAEPTPNDPAVSNVWGTILNTNFSLIDSAISGLLSLSVAGSSNVVLTQTNGAADQERNAIFIFTGALTGDVDVLFPASKTKVFTAKNSTTGAYVLSVGVNNGSGSPAGAVAAIAAGSSGVFYSDGTNVYQISIAPANPTFTGTVTFPDAATWTSGGINSLTALGIGMVPTNILDITQTQNSTSIAKILNANTGTASATELNASAGSTSSLIISFSQGFTTSGRNIQASTLIEGQGAGGVTLSALSGIVRVWANGAQSAEFPADGSFLVGSTTPAGAGAIGAAGNITAFYSDERLKDRLGPVTDAIAKVMSLSAFYYHANDFAHKVSGGMYNPSIREVGLSAQEVQKVLPEVVAPAPFNHDYLTLRYERIVTLLVAAVQEQQGQIDVLKAELAKK